MLKELTEEEFKRRASRSGRVAVFREFLADRETPVAALTRLGDEEEAFLLESVAGGEVRGRYSYLGIDPCAKFEGDNALDDVRAALAEARYEPAPELPSFQGGYSIVMLFHQLHYFLFLCQVRVRVAKDQVITKAPGCHFNIICKL